MWFHPNFFFPKEKQKLYNLSKTTKVKSVFESRPIYSEGHGISIPHPQLLQRGTRHCGLPRWFSGKELAWQCRRHRFDPWIRKIPWRMKWQPTPVFLPGKSHGQRSLMGYSPWGRMESDMTEQLSTHTHTPVPERTKLCWGWLLALSSLCSPSWAGWASWEPIRPSLVPRSWPLGGGGGETGPCGTTQMQPEKPRCHPRAWQLWMWLQAGPGGSLPTGGRGSLAMASPQLRPCPEGWGTTRTKGHCVRERERVWGERHWQFLPLCEPAAPSSWERKEPP